MARIPENLKNIAPVLMAGEQVLWMGKPHKPVLLMYEGIFAVGAFALLFCLMSIFGGLPVPMTIASALLFAICGAGITHYFIATSTYVISDRRVLVVSDFSGQLQVACDLEEITGYKMPGFGNILIIQRANGRPIRLFALANRQDAENALNGEEPDQ